MSAGRVGEGEVVRHVSTHGKVYEGKGISISYTCAQLCIFSEAKSSLTLACKILQ